MSKPADEWPKSAKERLEAEKERRAKAQQLAAKRTSFFVFSRLFVQSDGSFVTRPAGIFKAHTLDQALCYATVNCGCDHPVLLKLEAELPTPDHIQKFIEKEFGL